MAVVQNGTVDPNVDIKKRFHDLLMQYIDGAILWEEYFNAFVAFLIEQGVVVVDKAQLEVEQHIAADAEAQALGQSDR